MNDAQVLAIDPGKTCGYSFGFARPNRVRAGHGQQHWTEMLQTVEDTRVERIVIENFHTRIMNSDAEMTIKVIGAIEWIGMSKQIEVVFVEPSTKMKYREEVHSIKGDHARSAEAVRLWDFDYGSW